MHVCAWRWRKMRHTDSASMSGHVESSVKVGCIGAAYSFPLAPPALKLIRKQQLSSNCELKWLLWNAVAMESSCKVQRQRRSHLRLAESYEDDRKSYILNTELQVAPLTCREVSFLQHRRPLRIPEMSGWKCCPTGFGWNFLWFWRLSQEGSFIVCAK